MGANDLWFWENVTGQTAPKTELRKFDECLTVHH